MCELGVVAYSMRAQVRLRIVRLVTRMNRGPRTMALSSSHITILRVRHDGISESVELGSSSLEQ
jgi:hypothetical protein